VELGVLGTIPVAGKTSNEAAAAISAYLEKDYYKRATVQVQILKKALGSVPFFKVTVDGKVSRAGRQLFTEADPLTLSEAVIASNPTEWANLKRVQLTRGTESKEYDVEAITKGGRTEMDVRLRDGDRIYVTKRGWKFGE
jgi:protein involved in polysaccharide export with SLBB domain